MVPKRRLTQRPPDSHELDRLRVFNRTPSKRPKQYIDPITDNVYSARQVQIARAGGINPETHAYLKKIHQLDAYTSGKQRGERFQYLAERYAQQYGGKASKALRDKKFWKLVKDLGAKGNGARGKRAHALVAFGLRNWSDKHRVGSSPKPQDKK